MNRPFWIAVALLAACGLFGRTLTRLEPTGILRPLAELPETIGTFQKVKDDRFDEKVEAGAGMDEYIMRYYRDPDGFTLNLYVGYYRWQYEGHIIHSPKHCLPGSGWVPVEERRIPIPGGVAGTMNEVFLQKGEEKQAAYFWYQGRGRRIASEYTERVFMILDTIMLRRSDGALVRVLGPVSDKEQTQKKIEAFLRDLPPVLDRFLPGREIPGGAKEKSAAGA